MENIENQAMKMFHTNENDAHTNGNDVHTLSGVNKLNEYSDSDSPGKIIFMRAVKYILEGLAVALAAFYIPSACLSIKEVMMIALTAAATFAILDTFSPVIAGSARSGSGFGIGLNLVGF